MASIENALSMLRRLPRVALNNIKDLREAALARKKKKELPRGKDANYKLGADHKGAAQRMSRPRLGFTYGGQNYLKIPKEYYYSGYHLKRQYVPLSLFQLQRMIDLGRVNPNEPIDLTTLCNTRLVTVDPGKREFGIHLTDEGVDVFKAKVNIEVQWVLSELVIAAVERNGGMITTKFYDKDCVAAMADTKKFFARGLPVPKNETPPLNAIEFYTSAQNRGYLANPEQIRNERFKLAQKYGYQLNDYSKDSLKDLFAMRKDPRQIWYGLEPGWLINLKDKLVLKPADKEWTDYYKS